MTGIQLQVTSYEGEVEVGKITKQWSGAVRELFTDVDYFGVTCEFANLSLIHLIQFLFGSTLLQ